MHTLTATLAAPVPHAIGLTGGIASGKSFVSEILGLMGASVVDTDVIARAVLAPGGEALTELVHALGPEILTENGALNRVMVRERVFSNARAKQQLEAITHPRIRTAVQLAVQQPSAAPYFLVVVPLMAEAGRYGFLREVLVVDAASATQLKRLCTRDGIGVALAQQMMAAQASRAQRLAIADHVLGNDHPEVDLRPAIASLHQRFARSTVPAAGAWAGA